MTIINFRGSTYIFIVILFFTLTAMVKHMTEPAFVARTEKEFVKSMHDCLDYLERGLRKEHTVNRKLVITQAALESNFARSRFAIEGNNLFGIRQFANLEGGMLPDRVPPTVKWRVARFDSKCKSVKYYIDLLNYNANYEDFRRERTYQLIANINVPMRYFGKLDRFATNPKYPQLLFETYKELEKI